MALSEGGYQSAQGHRVAGNEAKAAEPPLFNGFICSVCERFLSQRVKRPSGEIVGMINSPEREEQVWGGGKEGRREGCRRGSKGRRESMEVRKEEMKGGSEQGRKEVGGVGGRERGRNDENKVGKVARR